MERSSSGGVKTLRAMFENSTTLDVERGRSRGTSGASTPIRPLSRVRTDFIEIGNSSFKLRDSSRSISESKRDRSEGEKENVRNGETMKQHAPTYQNLTPITLPIILTTTTKPYQTGHNAAESTTTPKLQPTPKPIAATTKYSSPKASSPTSKVPHVVHNTPRRPPISPKTPRSNQTSTSTSTTTPRILHRRTPTVPIPLPAHLTAHTASSAAKHASTHSSVPTYQVPPSRRSSILSVAGSTAYRSSGPTPRIPLGMAAGRTNAGVRHATTSTMMHHQPAGVGRRGEWLQQSAMRTGSSASVFRTGPPRANVKVDNIFLARITRPTAASAGRAVEKVKLATSPLAQSRVVTGMREREKIVKDRAGGSPKRTTTQKEEKGVQTDSSPLFEAVGRRSMSAEDRERHLLPSSPLQSLEE
jgi:hypothetical protein